MTRVSDNSSKHSVNLATNRAKRKHEDLLLRGSSFKNITKPSDDPVGNTEVLALRSIKSDNDQYIKNANLAKSQLEYTESALIDLTDTLLRAKELAIQQASGLYGGKIRQQVAEEVNQLKLQSIAIANRRFGNRFIFSGHKTLTKAIDKEGNYLGDDGKMTVEISKDFFIPTNLNGLEVFYGKDKIREKLFDPRLYDQKQIQEGSEELNLDKNPERALAALHTEESQQKLQQDTRAYEERASLEERKYPGDGKTNLFHDLTSLRNALLTDNNEIIQDILERFDGYMDHIVKMRTKIGAISNSIENAISQTERDNINHETYRSQIEDVDIAELASDLQRQQSILNATYKTSSQLLNNSLLDFLR